jgi:hypothetical protein
LTRRDASTSSRSSSASRSAGSARKGARPSRDGKVDIFCPECGAQYRIAEEAIETKIQCADCKRTFFPKAVVGKRQKGQDHTKVYVGFGAAALVIIGSLVLMSRGGDKPSPKPTAPAVDTKAAQLQIDRKARQDQAMRWARAVAAAEPMTLRNYSDMADLGKALGVDAALVGDARDQAILAALPQNEASRLFSEMECTTADISEDAVRAGAGAVSFYFTSKPGDTIYDGKAGAVVTSQWRMDGSQMRLGSFALTTKPVMRGRRPGEGNTFKPSAEIAKPRQAETTRGGVVTKVTESDPAPIAHAADTPETVRQKIDKLVQDVIASADPDSPGQLWGRATSQLKELGRPGVARLMNALNDLYPDVQGNNQKISQVTRSLLDITGMAFAYDVRGSGDAAKDKPARESVIRQWFAWWWRYANDDFQTAIDKEETLDVTPKKPKADAQKPAK